MVHLIFKSGENTMRPIFYSGDDLYYRKITFGQVKTNDIVIINKDRRIIAHRVIYKNSRYIVTKGDSNLKSDGKIYPGNLTARVVKIKRDRNIFRPEDIYLSQSTVYFNEIVRIKKEFEEKGIDFVFLKGLPLHLYIEKSHPKRLYFDCDVLIKENDYSNAEKILLGHGYKQADSRRKKNPFEITYNKIINGFMVSFDLHLKAVFTMTRLDRINALYPQKLIDQLTSDMLRTKRPIKIYGESFFILNSQYLIIYLALHFFHHGFRGAFRLELLAKIISLTARNKYLWFGLTDKILKYHLQNFVYPVFVLLIKYYKTPIPKRFLVSVQSLSFLPKYLSSRIYNRGDIFDDIPLAKSLINRFMNLFFLSPSPVWKKLQVMLYPRVLYMIFWTLWKRQSANIS